MSSWAGFTNRLRHHARNIDVKPATRGYLLVAADRIEDLENRLYLAECELKSFRATYDSSQDLRGHQR